MSHDFQAIKQVKVPVTDLQTSVTWYCTVFNLHLAHEFVENGILRGAVLANHDSGFVIGLRHREVVPGQPSFPGFDLFSLAVADPEALQRIADRLDELGVQHGEPVDRGAAGIHLDIPDPDGTVIRLLTPATSGTDFAGVILNDGEPPTFYDTPRLNTPADAV